MTNAVLSNRVQQGWVDAQADAGVTDLGVRVYPYAGPPPLHIPTAVLYAPNTLVDGAGVLSREQRDDTDQNIAHHRILVSTSANDDALIAKLRHELEHVTQWEARGKPLFDLYRASNAGLEVFIGEDRRGSAMLYNIIPLEADANAAAARFMRNRLSTARANELASTEEGVLFREQPPPGAVTTAGRRMLCFAALTAERIEALLASYPGGARELLDALADSPTLWDRLRADEQLNRRIGEANSKVPSSAEIADAAPDFRQPWVPLRQSLLDGYARAIDLANV